MMTTTNTPRIYVACLAAYNNGKLHGAWVDATQDADDMRADVESMLAASPEKGAEEWAVHDSEGLGLQVPSDLDEVARRAALFAAHDEDVVDAVLAYHGGNIDWTETSFEDGFQTYGSWSDWGYDYLEESGQQIAENLQCHFDYAGFAEQTLQHDYNVFEVNGKVYVFSFTLMV